MQVSTIVSLFFRAGALLVIFGLAACGENEGENNQPPVEDEWGPSVILTEIKLEGTDCCFDYTGNDRINNAFGRLFSAIQTVAPDFDANQQMADAIEDGELTLVLEFKGLQGIDSSQEFEMHGLFSEASGEGHLVVPSTFDDAGNTRALIRNGRVEEDGGTTYLRVGPTTIETTVQIFEVWVDLTLDRAQIEAQVIGSSLDNGLLLGEIKFGAVVNFLEIMEGVNSIASRCDCLGNPAQIVVLQDPNDMTSAECVFDEEPENITCGEDESICNTLVGIDSSINPCELFGLVPVLVPPDLRSNSDGPLDSYSAGMTFRGEPTTVLGIRSE